MSWNAYMYWSILYSVLDTQTGLGAGLAPDWLTWLTTLGTNEGS